MLLNNKFIVLNEIDSTNDYLAILDENESVSHGTIVIAENQYSGKGQKGNQWLSEAGKNMIFSFILKPVDFLAENQFFISMSVSLAITGFLNQFLNSFSIKWPNDIYFDNKKIAGILIEHSVCNNLLSRSIVGIGININQLQFPPEIPNPVSLRLITGNHYDISELMNSLIGFLNDKLSMCLKFDFKRLKDEYCSKLIGYKKVMKYNSRNLTFEAKILDVNSYGQIILELENGNIKIFNFQEIEPKFY